MLAVEAHQLHLLDRALVGRAGVEGHAGQEHRQADAVQVGDAGHSHREAEEAATRRNEIVVAALIVGQPVPVRVLRLVEGPEPIDDGALSLTRRRRGAFFKRSISIVS